ncbi:MAG: cupin domain-containing protein [Geminicoccaceae bacterium]|nr:cupin domain-containing protein [Geminicoccaceae bacterium]
MKGIATQVAHLPWETWEDPDLAARSAVRWKLLVSSPRTPTGLMSMGLAELAPGGVLPLHHHAPAEIYHVLDGRGRCDLDGTPHVLEAGVSLFIPPNARHRSVNTGEAPLHVLFVFPTDSFDEVVYHFDE